MWHGPFLSVRVYGEKEKINVVVPDCPHPCVAHGRLQGNRKRWCTVRHCHASHGGVRVLRVVVVMGVSHGERLWHVLFPDGYLALVPMERG